MKRSVPMKRARNQARRAGPKSSYRPPDIVSVSYQSAMLRTVADAERVPVHKFSAPDIPSEVLEAIRSERGEALGGAHGDPSWGEPIQSIGDCAHQLRNAFAGCGRDGMKLQAARRAEIA